MEAHLGLEALRLGGLLLLLEHPQTDANSAVVAAKREALESLRSVLPARHKVVVLRAVGLRTQGDMLPSARDAWALSD